MAIKEASRLDWLAQLRDELRVQVHLGGAEVRNKWEELDRKWVLLQSRLSTVRKARKDSARNVRAAARLLTQELATGYQSLREALKRL